MLLDAHHAAIETNGIEVVLVHAILQLLELVARVVAKPFEEYLAALAQNYACSGQSLFELEFQLF